jgi:hypothetical protein
MTLAHMYTSVTMRHVYIYVWYSHVFASIQDDASHMKPSLCGCSMREHPACQRKHHTEQHTTRLPYIQCLSPYVKVILVTSKVCFILTSSVTEVSLSFSHTIHVSVCFSHTIHDSLSFFMLVTSGGLISTIIVTNLSLPLPLPVTWRRRRVKKNCIHAYASAVCGCSTTHNVFLAIVVASHASALSMSLTMCNGTGWARMSGRCEIHGGILNSLYYFLGTYL